LASSIHIAETSKPPKYPPPSYSLRRRSRGGLARRAEIGVAHIPSGLSVVLVGSHTGGGRGVFERRIILGWQAIQVVSKLMSGVGFIVNSPPPPLKPPAALPGSCQTGGNWVCAKSIYVECCIGMASHTGGGRCLFAWRVILGWHLEPYTPSGVPRSCEIVFCSTGIFRSIFPDLFW
jgi:hypothetical protein